MGRGVLAAAGGSGGKPIFGVFSIVLGHFWIVLSHFGIVLSHFWLFLGIFGPLLLKLGRGLFYCIFGLRPLVGQYGHGSGESFWKFFDLFGSRRRVFGEFFKSFWRVFGRLWKSCQNEFFEGFCQIPHNQSLRGMSLHRFTISPFLFFICFVCSLFSTCF